MSDARCAVKPPSATNIEPHERSLPSQRETSAAVQATLAPGSLAERAQDPYVAVDEQDASAFAHARLGRGPANASGRPVVSLAYASERALRKECAAAAAARSRCATVEDAPQAARAFDGIDSAFVPLAMPVSFRISPHRSSTMQTAASMARARFAGRKLLRDMGPKPRDMAEALDLQRAVSEALGWTQCGWKVGAASPTAQAITGLYEPYAAPLFAERLFHSGDLVPTRRSNSRIVEPELAFVMRSSLPPRRRAYRPDEVLAAVASVRPALEVVNPRLTRKLDEAPEWLVADGGMNDALVLGPPSAAPPAGGYASIHARAKLNGAWLTSGIGVNVLGGPDRALTWLANWLSRNGRMLQADDVVTTGMLTDIIPCRHGDLVTADFGALGCVHARF